MCIAAELCRRPTPVRVLVASQPIESSSDGGFGQRGASLFLDDFGSESRIPAEEHGGAVMGLESRRDFWEGFEYRGVLIDQSQSTGLLVGTDHHATRLRVAQIDIRHRQVELGVGWHLELRLLIPLATRFGHQCRQSDGWGLGFGKLEQS